MKLRVLARWVVAAPLAVLLVDFALTNTDPVRLGLFPLGELPFEIPLSLAILLAMGLGFLLGGLRLWTTALRHRRAARRAEESMRLLEVKHQELKSRSELKSLSPGPVSTGPVLAPPG